MVFIENAGLADCVIFGFARPYDFKMSVSNRKEQGR